MQPRAQALGSLFCSRMLNFAQFRLLSFDCYGTLIDWETGIFSALRPILAAHGKTIADSGTPASLL